MNFTIKSAISVFGFIGLAFWPPAKSVAQNGCTDPLALNYDATATSNDGSCVYPVTNYPPPLVANLPTVINEASGAEFFGGQLWVHQDGGGSPLLFTLDTLTGALLQTYPLPTLENVDWEELAEDADHLYIGDFGNNPGNRTDLRIYKINKNDLLAGTATAETIDFYFSDQTDFTPSNQSTNFDCEAFIAIGDSLHVFSKRWLDQTTHHYVLPNMPGSYEAELRDSFDVGMLVSGADISSDGTILLLGYDGLTSETSLWLLWDYPENHLFGGNKRELILGSALNMSQAEGIAFSSNTTGFICSEELFGLPQRLHRFDLESWLNGTTATHEPGANNAIKAYPNPFSSSIHLGLPSSADDQMAEVSIVSALGTLAWKGKIYPGENSIPTSELPVGAYLLIVRQQGKTSTDFVLKH